MLLKLLENKKLIAVFLIIFGFILLGERLWFYKKVRQKLIKPYVEGSFAKIEPNRPLIIKDLPAFQLDGELNEWKGIPFSLRLSADENQNIQVMLAKTPQGLALGFQFSGSAEGLARKLSDEDKLFFHLRLKMANPTFFLIGVGDQLFDSQWLVALKEVQKLGDLSGQVIVPQDSLQVREYLPRSFELLIPWSAVPAVNYLKFENISLGLSLGKKNVANNLATESLPARTEKADVMFELDFDFR